MDVPQRKPNRLKGYDYSQPGGYFVTICTQNRRYILRRGAHCAPENRFPPLSVEGEIAEKAILEIKTRYPGVCADKYVIMPNHIHLLLRIETGDGRTMCAPTPITVSRVIWGFKRSVTKRIGASVWQKGYHDHIIRDEADYLRIWEYIDTHPAKWREDCYYAEVEK